MRLSLSCSAARGDHEDEDEDRVVVRRGEHEHRGGGEASEQRGHVGQAAEHVDVVPARSTCALGTGSEPNRQAPLSPKLNMTI